MKKYMTRLLGGIFTCFLSKYTSSLLATDVEYLDQPIESQSSSLNLGKVSPKQVSFLEETQGLWDDGQMLFTRISDRFNKGFDVLDNESDNEELDWVIIHIQHYGNVIADAHGWAEREQKEFHELRWLVINLLCFVDGIKDLFDNPDQEGFDYQCSGQQAEIYHHTYYVLCPYIDLVSLPGQKKMALNDTSFAILFVRNAWNNFLMTCMAKVGADIDPEDKENMCAVKRQAKQFIHHLADNRVEIEIRLRALAHIYPRSTSKTLKRIRKTDKRLRALYENMISEDYKLPVFARKLIHAADIRFNRQETLRAKRDDQRARQRVLSHHKQEAKNIAVSPPKKRRFKTPVGLRKRLLRHNYRRSLRKEIATDLFY